MRITQTPPTGTNVVSLADAKLFLRIDHATSDEDSLITALINAAVAYCENYCSRQWDKRAVTYCLRRPYNVKFPIGDLDSVTSVKMRTKSGELYSTTLTADDQYFVRLGTPSFMNFKNTPTPDPDDLESVKINVTHGVDAANIPDNVIHAVKMLVGHYYDNRQSTIVGTTAAIVPFGVHALLNTSRYTHAS